MGWSKRLSKKRRVLVKKLQKSINKIPILNNENLLGTKYNEGNRSFYPHITMNDVRANRKQDFPNNSYKSTKYQPWTFVPKILYEQFHKATSLYFLLIACITLVPAISPITPWTSWAGLIFIIAAAAIREALEDLMRRKADLKFNRTMFEIIEPRTGKKVKVRSQNIKVGSLVYLANDQALPADIVVLASALDDGVCYIETAQLDGETNLKERKAPKETCVLTFEELADLNGTINAEIPHPGLYEFKGSMGISNIPKSDEDGTEMESTGGSNKIALSETNLLLTGASLRNTPWIVGVVVYAGVETKLSLNQKKPPSKRSRLDSRLDLYVFGIFCVKMCLCFIMAICAFKFEITNTESNVVGQFTYLPEDPDGAAIWAIKTFFSYFILLSYLIPLSMVVQLEVVKVFQGRWMEWDNKMALFEERQVNPAEIKYKKQTFWEKLLRRKPEVKSPWKRKGMKVKSSSLTDDLGKVKYIMSDKTGTLTENKMVFKKASIRGTLYSTKDLVNLAGISGDDSDDKGIRDFILCLGLCHAAVGEDKNAKIIPKKPKKKGFSWGPGSKNKNKGKGKEIEIEKVEEEQIDTSRKPVNPEDLIYKSSSPDEECLVAAARDFGCAFVYKSGHGMELLHFNNQNESADPKNKNWNDSKKQIYEFLNVIPFNSDRKRMSVIVRDPETREIIIYCKGADSVMFDRLDHHYETDLHETIRSDLLSMAETGLRTLILAQRVISEEEYKTFNSAFQRELNSLADDRETKIAEVAATIENNFTIIGCTAIEDKLQDKVPETIAYLRLCGIKVWMITGDMPFTAINIGYSTKLIDKTMRVKKLLNATDEAHVGSWLERNTKKYIDLKLQLKQKYKHNNEHNNNNHNNSSFQPSFFSKLKRRFFSEHEVVPLGEDEVEEREEIEEEHDELSDDDDEDAEYKEELFTGLSFVIDGKSLEIALSKYPEQFYLFTKLCKTVICARTSPKQKAKIVKIVKTYHSKHSKSNAAGNLILGIGDGANDVSMIQTAQIGIGIFGKEGRSAVRASDFAIQQFSHLRRLLTIHGRYSFLRNSLLIHYSFYKNAAVFLCQLWFGIFSCFSAQSLFDDWVMTFFNIIFTSLPPMAAGVFERDLSEVVLKDNPETYKRTQKNVDLFNMKTLFLWVGAAIWHSVVLYFGAMAFIGGDFVDVEGRSNGIYSFGNAVLFVGMCVIFMKLALEINTYNWVVHLLIWGSLIIYIVVIVLENLFAGYFPAQYYVVFHMFELPMFYWWLLLGTVVCLLPDTVYKYYVRVVNPTDWMILQEQNKKRKAKLRALRRKKKIKNIVRSAKEFLHPLSSTLVNPHAQHASDSKAVYGEEVPRRSHK